MSDTERQGRFPPWLVRTLPAAQELKETGCHVHQRCLHTVCEEARCPNILECYSRKTATFLLLGKTCTRACGFCNIQYQSSPPPPDPEEIYHLVEAVSKLQLRHVVLTMVTRDDLEDGGSEHVAQAICALKKEYPSVTIEVLTSDFEAKGESLERIAKAEPTIFNHNIETVSRLTPRVRHKATYRRSLDVLSYMHTHFPMCTLKSGLMVGLGETHEEVLEALRDLHHVGVSIVTIGQYLQPSKKNLPVHEFVHPDVFEEYKKYGRSLGFQHVSSGPFVRSSYHAQEFV